MRQPQHVVAFERGPGLLQGVYSMIIMTSIWHFALAVPDLEEAMENEPKHYRIGADYHQPVE